MSDQTDLPDYINDRIIDIMFERQEAEKQASVEKRKRFKQNISNIAGTTGLLIGFADMAYMMLSTPNRQNVGLNSWLAQQGISFESQGYGLMTGLATSFVLLGMAAYLGHKNKGQAHPEFYKEKAREHDREIYRISSQYLENGLHVYKDTPADVLIKKVFEPE